MATADATVTVTISGSEYTLRSGGNPEYVRKLAAYVDRKIAEVESSAHDLPPNRLAILAALNIADELGRSRGIPDDEVTRLHRRIREILSALDGNAS